MSPVRVGAVQAESIFLDLQGAVAKTIDYIKQASEKGIQVLGFPEVWIGGYPWTIWSKPAFENALFSGKYIANSLPLDSPEMQRIQDACKEYNVFVVLGYSEREGASIYLSQAFISNTGEIIHNRRKIKPTHVERSLWGDGQADSLKTVVDTPFGKVGGLNCWEHLQPLLRYYMYSQGVQIHVAGWPPFPQTPADVAFPFPYHATAEANYRISQFVAVEGQTFVLCATQMHKMETLKTMGLDDKGMFTENGGGFAMIFGPDGRPLVEPLSPGEEGIVSADIDLDLINLAKNMADPVGHYSRPDLLSLKVTTEPAKIVHKE